MVLLFSFTKRNLRTGNWEVRINLSFLSLAYSMPLTGEEKPKPEWWWAWSQSILGRTRSSSTQTSSDTRGRHLAERVSWQHSAGQAGPWRGHAAELGNGLPHPAGSHLCMAQLINPTSFLYGPCALLSCLSLGGVGAAVQPLHGAWLPSCLALCL